MHTETMPASFPEHSDLKAKVIDWTWEMRINSSYEFKFSPTSGSSIFASCFALYILDLFKETDNLSREEKDNWTDYINSFQNEKDGLFYPDPILHPDKERAVFQLTCFCLSALDILGSAPKNRLSIVDKWKTEAETRDYLFARKVHLGKGGSGNKAMFQAIMLTHEYEKTKDEKLLIGMNTWFDFHDQYQNNYGYWGVASKRSLYSGVQNAFHQFVIYDYWKRNYSNIDFVAKTAVRLQDRAGFFAPVSGGGACKDYDAIHYLLASQKTANSAKGKIALKKALRAVNKCWNQDGGFCENIYRPLQSYKILHYFVLASSGYDWSIWLTRLKHIAKDLIRKQEKKSRKWVPENQSWNESTLWDTWFRSLSIAEILCFFNPENYDKYRFHKHIGIGYKSTSNNK